MDPMFAYRVNPQTTQNGPMQVIAIEPFVYEALRSLKGKRAVLDTTRGSVSGMVVDAKPDYVVIQEYDSTFFVRIREIVWIMPES
ncbi:YuzF family protein [Cytobacillus firmus]|uniref:YuzF family protein n=1 Tax=Cytobacillus firmus TaxID=1399 RepID=UPI0024C1DE32|nr:YuzF family protein [Cytobacillus firmus]WHY34204.1 YuzF family protein [Cytobacillus firmus]